MSRVRRHAVFLVGCVLALSAGGASAETAVGAMATAETRLRPARSLEVPGRWIETITVDGLSFASPALIVAESRLVGGRTYTETDLRDAVRRVRRLPFVRDADFAVRRGSVRGRYALVIGVEETRRVFLGENAIVTRTDARLALARGPLERESVQLAPQVGGRLFLGRYNVVFGSVGGGEGAQIGFQRYNLFGRGGVLGLGIQRAECCATRLHDAGLDPTFSVWRDEGDRLQLSLDLGLPLVGNQALRVAYSHRRGEEGIRRFSVFDSDLESPVARFPEFLYEDLRRHRLEVAWSHDTTDDPLFPHHGSRFEVGFDLATLTAEQGADLSRLDLTSQGAAVVLSTSRTRQFQVVLSAARTWSMGRRHAVSLGVQGAVGRARLENLPVGVESVDGLAMPVVVDRAGLDIRSAGVSAGYRVSLLSARQRLRAGDLYWEGRLRYDHERADLAIGLPRLGRLDTVRLETSVAFRSAWGLFRLTFQWIELSS